MRSIFYPGHRGSVVQECTFIQTQESISMEKLAEIYVRKVVARHGVPVSVVLDRDDYFTSRFWMWFHDEMGTRLHFSTAFHP